MTRRPPEEDPGGGSTATSPKVLVACGLAGFVFAWLARHAASAGGVVVPVVGWTQGLVLFIGAAGLFVLTRVTRTAVSTPARRPEAHQLVNRLVLARACALVGALVAGGYAGYALSWLGIPSALLGERLSRSLVASLGGVMLAVTALWLERACRVPPDRDAD